jgi:hypothetical protein
MIQLQESLIGLGVVVVVGVIAYNKWQEWRAKKSVEQAFSTAQDDVLMAEGQPSNRQEPVLSPFEGPDVVVGHAPAVEVEHGREASVESHGSHLQATTVRRTPARRARAAGISALTSGGQQAG